MGEKRISLNSSLTIETKLLIFGMSGNALPQRLRQSGADTVVNVATIEFRFRAIVLIEKFVLDVAYEKIGVAGSHFCAHGHTIDLFIVTVSE